jgi:curved DNA-binding protein CbpA
MDFRPVPIPLRQSLYLAATIRGASGRSFPGLKQRRETVEMQQKERMSMGNQAYQVLGIAPTADARAVRAAFLRIARIYHPDRFVEGPDDVRLEAERRMKEATLAYESIQSATKAAKKHPKIDEKKLQARAKKFREEIEAKRIRDERDRARWMRWEAAEQQAREAAEVEAEMAARIESDVDGTAPRRRVHESPEPAIENNGPKKRDPLAERLDAARRGVTSPLVPQRAER